MKKVFWNEIKHTIKAIAPDFAAMIDDISPGTEYPLYLLTFPFGALVGDDKSQFIPNTDGSFYRLQMNEAPSEIVSDLGYGFDSSPLGLVLSKCIEFFIDLPEKKMSIPIGLINPGSFFNYAKILNKEKPLYYAPNSVLCFSAGARTVFSLPYLTCHSSFRRLEREIGSLNTIPTAPYDHWQLFKDMVNAVKTEDPWQMQLLYFSKKWIDDILDNPSWHQVKSYLFQLAWRESEYTRNQFYFDIAYSLMQERGNFAINPYLTDTARHILDICVGTFPGLAPTCNEVLVPLKTIQHTLTYAYGLKKYIPTIMAPAYYSFNEPNDSVYYSLQTPTTRTFSPKTKNAISTLTNLEDLSRIIDKFTTLIREENGMWQGTILKNQITHTTIAYIHTSIQDNALLSNHISTNDPRFEFYYPYCAPDIAVPAISGNFFRGCVKLTNMK